VTLRSHIDSEWLDGRREASPAEGAAIVSHLRACDACAVRYVERVVHAAPLVNAAPDDIWPAIQARLESRVSQHPRRVAVSRRAWAQIAALAAICVAFVIAFAGRWLIDQRHVSEVTLDLGRYISSLEATSATPTSENVQRVLPAFVEYDRSAALRDTGLRPQVEEYHLAAQRVLHTHDVAIVELVYESGQDAFLMFVAPRGVTVSFDGYHLVDADLYRLPCRRVVCPRQDIFWSTIGERQYIFIRTRTSPDHSDHLYSELILNRS
jgi:hypothetical protein